jgi:superfamily II DNA helicase RecQ
MAASKEGALNLFVPRLKVHLSKAKIDLAIEETVRKLGYSRATEDQLVAIREFVLGRDVFVMLPTGSGKSLCYAALPFVFDALKGEVHCSSIVVVVSPLQSIMVDQVRKYSAKGVLTAFIGKAQKDESVRLGVENGRYQLVYLSPEAMLLNLRWRETLRSDIYQSNLVCLAVDEAHCIEKWGVDFRQEFSNIGEVRSLLPRWTNVMALTATANVMTQQNIIKSLEMKEVLRICKMPNVPNLFLSVVQKPECEISQIVTPIVNEIAQNGISADKYLVFCRSYKETMELFQEAVLQLDSRNALYVSPPSGTDMHPQSYRRTCEKYDACTAERMKDHIVRSFTDAEGTIRSVFATIAFAMGLDSPNIVMSCIGVLLLILKRTSRKLAGVVAMANQRQPYSFTSLQISEEGQVCLT